MLSSEARLALLEDERRLKVTAVTSSSSASAAETQQGQSVRREVAPTSARAWWLGLPSLVAR
jgi:hypothetical protein